MNINEQEIRFSGRIAIKEALKIGQEIDVDVHLTNETVTLKGEVMEQKQRNNQDGTIDQLSVIGIYRI